MYICQYIRWILLFAGGRFLVPAIEKWINKTFHIPKKVYHPNPTPPPQLATGEQQRSRVYVYIYLQIVYTVHVKNHMSCLLKLYIYICTICVCACVSGCRSCKNTKSWVERQIGSKSTKKTKNKKILESHKKTWKTLSWLCFEDFVVNSAKIIPAILPKCLAGFSTKNGLSFFFISENFHLQKKTNFQSIISLPFKTLKGKRGRKTKAMFDSSLEIY